MVLRTPRAPAIEGSVQWHWGCRRNKGRRPGAQAAAGRVCEVAVPCPSVSRVDGLSEWPSERSGWSRFRIRCFNILSSGNPPSVCWSATPRQSRLKTGSGRLAGAQAYLAVPDQLDAVVKVHPDSEPAARLGRRERLKGDAPQDGHGEGEEQLSLDPDGPRCPGVSVPCPWVLVAHGLNSPAATVAELDGDSRLERAW